MKKVMALFGMAFLFVVALSVPAYAMVKATDSIIVREDEVINDDFFAAGNEVIIEGTVNGDVYVGAESLTVRGTVNGDVIAGATTIEVTGEITEDLRVAGNSISLIGAEIGDSVTVAGNELKVDSESTIGGGLLFGGNRLSLDGSVGRGIMSGSDKVRIDSEVGSTVRVAATDITIDKDAVIAGNLEYNSENKADVEGQVLGEIIQSDSTFNVSTEGIMRWFVVGFTAWAYFGALIIAAVLVIFAPNLFKKTKKNFDKKPWRVLGIGALTLLATLPLVVILFMTVFGIPLALVLFVLWLLAIYFAKFFVGYRIGSYIFEKLRKDKKENRRVMYAALLVGLAIYYMLRIVPVIGFFVSFFTTVVGLGMIMSLYTKTKKLQS